MKSIRDAIALSDGIFVLRTLVIFHAIGEDATTEKFSLSILLLIFPIHKLKLIIMKKNLLFLFLLIASYKLSVINAQVPQSVNYQAVARNTLGIPIMNASVAVRIIIHDGSASGTVVYSERDTATTNAGRRRGAFAGLHPAVFRSGG